MTTTDNTPDKETTIDDSEDDLEKKLELDKFEVAPSKKAISPTLTLHQAEEPEAQSNEEPLLRTRAIPKALVLGAAIFIGALIFVLFLLWKSGVIFSKPEVVPQIFDFYVDFGPLSTTSGRSGTLTLSLKIHATVPELKAEIIKKDQILKSRLLNLLGSETAQEIIRKKDFTALKPYLIKEINQSLSTGTVDEVYYASLILK